MNSIADGTVIIQTSSQSVLATPSWFGETTLIVAHLRKQGAFAASSERVRFARRCLTVIDCQLARPSRVFWQR